ncbi:MAG: bifunctional UDP-N-acetylglucosamine diphosphorylase/glucosamine-1-phosphate N-acetyltransferase GlmU [Pseudomonadota bacterium]
MSLSVVVLAAGKGTRMRSKVPKMLHAIGGKPMLTHVLETAVALQPDDIAVVVGFGSEQIKTTFPDSDYLWVEQTEQNGTGHAVQQAMPSVSGDKVLVLFGDVPLIESSSLQQMLAALDDNDLCLLTVNVTNPFGYGRILRHGDRGTVAAIVEHKDADVAQRKIREVNTGMLAAKRDRLDELLDGLDNDNAQGEYLLTDVVAAANARSWSVDAVTLETEVGALGVNNRAQLAELERTYQALRAKDLMESGVTLADPSRIDVRGTLACGSDSYIDVNCVFEGQVTIGNDVRIGPNCTIKDSTIASASVIEANCVIENSQIAQRCSVGPFARLRPGTTMHDNSKLGNFVETKNSEIGQGSKVNHLAYVGDSDVADECNIGAGTITANYDGANKHRTVIESGVFVGSNSVLVAPLQIGAGATVGAGSTVTRDVGKDELVITRAKSRTVNNWQRPKKK